MRRVALSSFLVLVTGCSEPQRAATPERGTPQAAQAQRSEGYSSRFEWWSGRYEDRAVLSFTIPETDAVGVGMECARGSRLVRISAVDPNAMGTRLVFGSRETQASVDATPSQNTMIDDSTYVAATVEVSHPVLTALEDSGELWVWTAEHPMRAESDEERAAIAAFFEACRG